MRFTGDNTIASLFAVFHVIFFNPLERESESRLWTRSREISATNSYLHTRIHENFTTLRRYFILVMLYTRVLRFWNIKFLLVYFIDAFTNTVHIMNLYWRIVRLFGGHSKRQNLSFLPFRRPSSYSFALHRAFHRLLRRSLIYASTFLQASRLSPVESFYTAEESIL